jgi:hypothetical protein
LELTGATKAGIFSAGLASPGIDSPIITFFVGVTAVLTAVTFAF